MTRDEAIAVLIEEALTGSVASAAHSNAVSKCRELLGSGTVSGIVGRIGTSPLQDAADLLLLLGVTSETKPDEPTVER